MDIFGEIDWEREFGPARGTRLGPRIGAQQLGATLYELDPGGQAAPYHLHHGNEELLIVLEGQLELRAPDGVQTVHRGGTVAFVAGPEGAHRVRNRGTERARYLVVSTMRFPEVAEQLDTGTVLPMKGPGDGWAFASGTAGDYLELTRQALAVEPEDSSRS